MLAKMKVSALLSALPHTANYRRTDDAVTMRCGSFRKNFANFDYDVVVRTVAHDDKSVPTWPQLGLQTLQ
jgi:hypothetical protein